MRSLVAEFLGTALLVATVVGSGIMAETLSGGNAGVALLANAIATGGVLYVLILGLGPISGAHFNPVVSLIEAAYRRLPRARLPGYLVAQIAGGCAGTLLAHAMFNMDLVQHATHARSTHGELLGEVVATFGLVLTIKTTRGSAAAIALFIVGAYWFTSSTSFANPAVTIARSLTNTFANIRAADVPLFIAAQLAGGGAAALVTRWLLVEDT
jgi:glycerol uptake facilitator-like aquaporin